MVDDEFLSKTYLRNHEHIATWIYKRWETPKDFFERGFCFCLVKRDKEIVSWAMSDWSTENYILMGCTTDENHREQGYATIVISAAAEYCMSKSIDLRWFCAVNNIASRETAETVGFEKIREQEIIIGEFD
jgi:RimJ/RimL family protein N-acetyltransferase